MQGLKGLQLRVNALLFLLLVSLVLGLSLAWERQHSPQGEPVGDRISYAAELMAHGLNREAAGVLETALERLPPGPEATRYRRVLAELCIEKLGDVERGLSQLVLIRNHDPQQASATEPLVRHCLDRLGRVYDVQRRLLLEKGENPTTNRIGTETVVAFGNEPGISFSELEKRLLQLGLPAKNPPKETVDRVLQNMAGELLLKRAARRSGLDKDSAFLGQIRQFEDSYLLQRYLEENVLKNVVVDEQALNLYLEKNREEFSSPIRVVYSEFAFPDETQARVFLNGQTPASSPLKLTDQKNSTVADLPRPLQGIKWEEEKPAGRLGPVEIDKQWIVYEIHEVVPGRQTAPDLARQQARLKLLEQKQSGAVSQVISELARKEELKILQGEIQKRFYGEASGTAKTKDGK